MARIVKERLKRVEKERNNVHQEVQATYTVFEKDGERYFQIDTYGKDDRAMPEKISQSFQIDKEMAKELVNLLNTAFN
jgi:hypothetical protein